MIVECLQTLPAVQRQVWQEKQYPAALKAAQLQVDLSSLPAGDDTEIGAQLGWHMTWLEDLQTERFGQSSTPKIDLSPCVCVCAFTCFVTTLFTSFCRIGWRRHSPTSLNTEFHSYVCPRKGINISGGQKVRQLSKSVWPVGQLQTWKDWLLGVDGKSSAKVNWWNQGNPINIHECSCWKNGNWI